jgi:hypothetical protein
VASEEVRVHEFKLGAEATQLLEDLKSKHALGTPRFFEVKRRLMPVKRPANAGKHVLGTPLSFAMRIPVKRPANVCEEND